MFGFFSKKTSLASELVVGSSVDTATSGSKKRGRRTWLSYLEMVVSNWEMIFETINFWAMLTFQDKYRGWFGVLSICLKVIYLLVVEWGEILSS
jgi:hypothetical protein